MKTIRIALIWRIIIAAGLGVALGNCLPGGVVRVFVTFNAIFSQFINFLVPLIIVGLVTPAIFRLGIGAGRLLLGTVVIAYTSTIVSGLFSYGVSSHFFPMLIDQGTVASIDGTEIVADPFFSLEIPPLLGVMTALVLAFLLGIFLNIVGGKTLEKMFCELEQVIILAISRILIPLLPIYIFGLFLKMTHTGEAIPVLSMFAKVIVIIFVLCLVYILVIFVLAGLVSRRNPLKALLHMLTAYVTALGTSSSAATIPVTLEQVKKCGVRSEIANFTIPLCATIHLPGSTIKIVACSVAVMIIQGHPLNLATFVGFILLLAITMVAAPGVPGGAIMAALGVLASSLGFGETDQALMIALYIVMDSFGTACNVTCDGAITMMIDRFASPISETTAVTSERK